LQRLLQDVVQLSRAQPGLPLARLLDQLHDRGVLLLLVALARGRLVICLPSESEVLASPLYAEPFDELLREDLPNGFFTGTP
jgi:hypothetical protein